MPLHKSNFTMALMAVTIVWDTRTHFRNRAKYAKLQQESLELCEALLESDAKVKYLAHLLDEHGYEPTEFDLFALHHALFTSE